MWACRRLFLEGLSGVVIVIFFYCARTRLFLFLQKNYDSQSFNSFLIAEPCCLTDMILKIKSIEVSLNLFLILIYLCFDDMIFGNFERLNPIVDSIAQKWCFSILGPWFRMSSIFYPEISDCEGAILELTGK